MWQLHGDASSTVSGSLQVGPCQAPEAQAGIDTSFNPPYGYTLYNGWNKDSYVGSAIQGDGKIVVSTGLENGTDSDVVLLRYNGDGTADDTFGTGGAVTYSGGHGDDCGRLVALQKDGKIVLTGYTDNGTDDDILTMRYNVDGTLDSSFGNNGIITYDNAGKNDFGRAVALQEDGKILVTARSSHISDASISAALMLRYQSDGTLDDSFGSNGVVTYEGGYGNDGFRAVALQEDGKIIVSGYTNTASGFDVLTARYKSDGILDHAFGVNGVVTHDGGHGNDGARGVAIQYDGKIVVSGGEYNGTDLDVLVLRYNSNGTPDMTFGKNGVSTYDNGNGNDYGRRLAIQGYEIVVTGRSRRGTDYDVLILRYDAKGNLDHNFWGNGAVALNIGEGNDYGEGVVIQPDDKIVISGGSFNGSDYDILALRLGVRYVDGGGSAGGCFIGSAKYRF